MEPEELTELKKLLKKFENNYQHEYPISCENAYDLQGTIDEISSE